MNRYFRNLYDDLASLIATQPGRGKPFLQTLLAREHTAQVDAGEREKREKQFRDARLRLLFCSPTMELGVDISSLNTVYMRNVPPTPANYAQRSGRAGRSGQPALVLSYCGATSPHDQYFFSDPTRMVAGAVSAPTLELANEELLKAHFRALWLAATRQRLPKQREGAGGSWHPREGRWWRDLREIADSDEACRSAQAAWPGDRRRPDGEPLVGGVRHTWLTGSWFDGLISGAALRFRRGPEPLAGSAGGGRQPDGAGRRRICATTPSQSGNGRRRISASGRPGCSSSCCWPTKPGSGNNNSDFSTYRYLASQGFMPGYNFPRLPLMAYIPGSREQVGGGTFITRPRFVGISEFGPHSLIYHEGNTYKVKGAILGLQDNAAAAGTVTLATQDALVCGACGHAHLGAADRAGALLPLRCAAEGATGRQGGAHAEAVSDRAGEHPPRRADHLRRRGAPTAGLRAAHHLRIPAGERRGKVARAQVSSGGQPLLELSYSPATQISRINLGWRRRENNNDMGFPIHPICGRWGAEKQLDSRECLAGDGDEDTRRSGLREDHALRAGPQERPAVAVPGPSPPALERRCS